MVMLVQPEPVKGWENPYRPGTAEAEITLPPLNLENEPRVLTVQHVQRVIQKTKLLLSPDPEASWPRILTLLEANQVLGCWRRFEIEQEKKYQYQGALGRYLEGPYAEVQKQYFARFELSAPAGPDDRTFYAWAKYFVQVREYVDAITSLQACLLKQTWRARALGHHLKGLQERHQKLVDAARDERFMHPPGQQDTHMRLLYAFWLISEQFKALSIKYGRE